MTNIKTFEEGEKILLQSLLTGPKILHTGSCSVYAITIAFSLLDKKYASLFWDEISITKQGRRRLSILSAKEPSLEQKEP